MCFSEEVNTLIEPCNHLCLCFDCCKHVMNSTNTCPICRSGIK
ncbi:MAG: RING-HC finger protein [Bdellovibrionales bacterium]|nr:RING-HC finger protein [Bdellovibrionales bacterium]